MRALARHRVFTREQLGEMFFDSQHRARVRLVALHRHQVLDRFQPHRPGWGAASYHYVLGPMGAAIVAAEAGEDPDRAARRWRGERSLALGRAQRLAHLVGVNGFYAALVGHARATPGAEFADWLTEAEATRWADGIVRPDAYGSWRHDGEAVEFFLEWDGGGETLGRLVAKLGDYERFESERGASAWVVFAFPSPRREAAARRALAGATVPVATAVIGASATPHDAVWLALSGNGLSRVGLAALSRLQLPPAATARARAGSVRAWRFERSRPAHDEGADGGQ